jgi:hypothetical protein
MHNLAGSYAEKYSIRVVRDGMLIKSMVTLSALFAVAFMSRFLVALLWESALAARIKRTRPVAIRPEGQVNIPTRKLSRLKVADQNEIRLIKMS